MEAVAGDSAATRLQRPAGRTIFSSTLSRFLVAGGISFACNQVLLFVLYEGVFGDWRPVGWFHHLDAGLLLSSAIAVELSILVRFLINDAWTFRAFRSKSYRRRLAESNVSSLASPAISLACINVLTPLLGVSYLIANALGVFIGLVWNWVWSTGYVWRREMTVAPEMKAWQE
jgi:putative flippase GtrA